MQYDVEMIGGIKRQLLELLSEIGFAPPNLYSRDVERSGGGIGDGVCEVLKNTEYVKRSDSVELVKAVVIAGLYPNVVKIERPHKGRGAGSQKGRDGKEKSGPITLMIRGGEEVHLHPSSIVSVPSKCVNSISQLSLHPGKGHQ